MNATQRLEVLQKTALLESAMAHESDRFSYTERDLMVQLRAEFKAFAEEVRRNDVSLQVQHNDHEKRLRTLENFRWYILGGAGIASVVGSLIARAFFH